ncbi:hypothetical protein [Leptolyngbya sp. FACHB-8]|uniref:hypothetical protein n=1 Tax=unclassified Leptolyngbya TaxID=2650499 RepID=UPI0016897984|nr:hypothetical protein [Leptolyngbya sp. FACHB-8]MBD1911268.1 hypothetical protein [Leptolyngbya sp. FACHB-8]
MNATTLNGSVVNSPVSPQRANAADLIDTLTLLPYTHERSLAVDLLLWHEELTWQERTWYVLNEWKGVEQ